MSHACIRRSLIVLAALSTGLTAVPYAQAPAPQTAPPAQATVAEQAPPKDLRPLLSPRQSEMRLVTARYTLDRGTLNANYLGYFRVGGRGIGGQLPSVQPLSPNRIARLKRFDLDWQAALANVNAAALSPAARTDLDSLKNAIQANLEQLESDEAVLAQLSPLVPFAPSIVDMVEARIRIEDIVPQKSAATLTDVTAAVGRVRARLEAGLANPAAPDALRVTKDVAQRGQSAVETLRGSLVEWFTFYNGYDPLFTWWNGVPFKKADAALQAYSAFLKDKLAGSGGAVSATSDNSKAMTIAPAPPPKFPSVPDLQGLMALPQDEMSDIVQRFRGPATGRSGQIAQGGRAPVSEPNRPGVPAAAPPSAGTQQGQAAGPAPSQTPPARSRAFYEGWLKALQSLNFDKLSRPAQVDYLYIKKMCEQQIARAGVTLPDNPPRKADNSGITGKARGRQGLIFDLQDELIPYTPEELIAIGQAEFAWCEAEMKKASRQLGLGDDWKRALERMKEIHPPPGGQVAAVRDLMFEAVDFLRARDLLTVPSVAAESLHMIMMTPERQVVNPFFTGGAEISVSYPTDTMDFDARLQSMRGNNTPFSHATAFHEMIPGHNLVFYTSARYRGYRPALGGNSPFYSEGWPLYWELMMYDNGFHDTPEKKIGALFWRMHRCARIIFSLKFHMGEWSPQECVDFLVDRVGFERENAMGEVRRSFLGGYGPLYQAAYLLGGLQLRALRKEVVESGQMTEKAFHDEVLRQGAMPIALLRLALGRSPLARHTSIDWKFYAGTIGS